MKKKLKEKHLQTDEAATDEEAADQNNHPKDEPSIDSTIHNTLNELRSQYLHDRSNSINRLLVFICIVLVFFAILIPIMTGIAVYFVYNKYVETQSQTTQFMNESKQHATDARKHASDAAQYLKEIKENQTKVKEIVSRLTSKDFSNPNKVEIFQTSLKEILQNPELTLEDKAIIEAYKLQITGQIQEAIEKWRSIANTAKGVNDSLVARAFFSIGHLHSGENENDQALSAYDEAIHLMPNFPDAYTSRGLVKSALGNPEAAIADHDEAIRLRSDFSEAYINRGTAKRALERHEEAISDFDEAIRLNPNSALAYTHRGVSRNALGQHQAAIADHNEAIRLNPNFVEAYINRASTKRALGKHDDAKADINKALRLAKEQEEMSKVNAE